MHAGLHAASVSATMVAISTRSRHTHPSILGTHCRIRSSPVRPTNPSAVPAQHISHQPAQSGCSATTLTNVTGENHRATTVLPAWSSRRSGGSSPIHLQLTCTREA